MSPASGALRRSAMIACLLGILAAGAGPARAFDWLGKIELDADGLASSDPQLRLQAVQRLGQYDVVWTRGYLLGALDDEDRRVRAAAARVLGRHRVAEARPAIVGWLAGADKEDQLVAAEVLGELGGEEAVVPLVRALGAPEHEVRLQAVVALGRIGGPRVVVPMIGRLEDDNAEVRRAAVTQLVSLGDRRAVIPLVGLFDDGSLDVRVGAITGAGRLGDRAIVPALLRLLRDPAEQVKIAAVTALGNLAALDAVDSLIDLLHSGSNDFRAKVAYGLGQIARAHPEDAAAGLAVDALVRGLADGRLRPAAREALHRAGAAAVPALVEHLAGKLEGDATTAVLLLRDIGDPRATPALVEELERGRMSRELVLDALGRTGDPRALVPVLGLLGDKDPAVRLGAMRALSPMLEPGSSAADVLVDLLDDPSPELRALAAEHLGAVRSRTAVPRLSKVVASREPPRVREAAVSALGAIGDRRATRVLLDVLRDGPSSLRLPAANALIYVKDPSAVEPLLTMARDASFPSREVAVRTLGGVLRDAPRRDARRALEELAARDRLTVSLAAIAALGALADPESRPVLAELANGASVDRRRAALEALGNLGDDAAAPLLLDGLRSTDDRVAASAAWALGKLGAADAAPQLYRATQRRGFATPVNASAALALLLAPEHGDRVKPLLHHRNRLVRANATYAAGRLRLDSLRAPLLHLLREDPSPLVRAGAARALSRFRGAESALREALADEGEERVRAALEAALAGPFEPPARTDWRSFYVVDPTSGDAPVRQEPYFLATSDGLVTALYTDARGEAGEERFPPGPHVLAPALRVSEY